MLTIAWNLDSLFWNSSTFHHITTVTCSTYTSHHRCWQCSGWL